VSIIFWQIITCLWQVVTGFIGAFIKAIWGMLPALLEIKKIMGYFTPAGIIALYIGVPTFCVSAVFFLVKRLIKAKV
jgi:hypothetical protein